MLARNRRLAAAGLIAAAAIAVPTAALASGSGSPSPKPAPAQASAAAAASKSAARSKAGSGSPSPKPAPAQASAAAAGKSAAQPQLPALAASAGISADRLQAGLVAMKRAGGNTPSGIAAFAASARVTNATARQIADAVFGTQFGHK